MPKLDGAERLIPSRDSFAACCLEIVILQKAGRIIQAKEQVKKQSQHCSSFKKLPTKVYGQLPNIAKSNDGLNDHEFGCVSLFLGTHPTNASIAFTPPNVPGRVSFHSLGHSAWPWVGQS